MQGDDIKAWASSAAALTKAINLPASLAPAQGRLANQLEPDRSQDRLPALATFLRGRRGALLLPGTRRLVKSACTQAHGVDILWDYPARLPFFVLQAGDLKLSVTSGPVTPLCR